MSEHEPANVPADDDLEDHDRGLLFDLQTLVQRRTVLGLVGGLGVLAGAAACGAASAGTTAASSTSTTATSGPSGASSSAGARSTTSTSAAGSVAEVPDETAGPYRGDGSNGPDVLDDSGIVRSDITSSFGSSTTRAAGIPLTVKLTVRDAESGAAMVGAAVYLWHCDRDGRYSMYSQGVTGENYLRGVQATDSEGTASFTSIYRRATPGAGRTSISRSTAVSARPPPARGSSRRRRSPCRRRPAARCTQRTATPRACATSARCPCSATTSSAATAAFISSRPCPGRQRATPPP